MLSFGVLVIWRRIVTVNICDEDVLYGNQAVEALDEYIRRLEKQKVEGRTQKQISTLIKMAKLMRTAIIQSESF